MMRDYGAPEMVRVPLEELVLQIHSLRLGRAARFLDRVLEPPPSKAVAAALALLQQVHVGVRTCVLGSPIHVEGTRHAGVSSCNWQLCNCRYIHHCPPLLLPITGWGAGG